MPEKRRAREADEVRADAPQLSGVDPLRFAGEFAPRLHGLRDEVARVIVGQERVIDELLIALLAGGHVILEGVPGLAKTLLVQTLASTLSLKFGRVQFTPDLMPADITGTLVIARDRGGIRSHFHFQKGPIFVNVLLADEINRTPPKTQAALLEATAERQVSVAGKCYPLPEPFLVLATQNSIEQEGTYPLPEAQLDRFLLKVLVDYPTAADEAVILKRTTGDRQVELRSALTRDELVALQHIVQSLPVSQHVMHYATRLVRRSRPEESESPPWVQQDIAWGAGPRGVQSLLLAAKARTLLTGRFCVTRADVREVALPVLRHRIIPSFRAEGEGRSTDDLICQLLLDTSPFPAVEGFDGATRKLLRL